VTSMDIHEALKEKGYEIDRRRINLRDAIKETGDFTVPVRLHREVIVEIPVTVENEGGAQNAAAAPTTAAESAPATPAAEPEATASEAENG
jgi:large subunit ribosomal protein L9